MSFANNVGMVTLINIGNAIFSVVTIAATAYYFGTSKDIEIYFSATLLLTVLSSLANSGQLSDLFLPIYHRIAHTHSSVAAQQACWVLVNNSTVLIGVMLAFLYLLSDVLVDFLVPGFSSAGKHQVELVSFWVLPLLYFNVISAYLTTFINAEEKFGSAELVSLYSKILHLLCLFIFVDAIGVWSLIVGLWAGALLRFSTLLVILRRHGFRYEFVFRSPFVQLRDIALQVGYSYIYVVCAQIFVVAINSSVSQLPQGTFAIFRYVQQLYDRTNGIFLRPLSLVFFTKASRIVATGSNELRSITDRAFGIFLAIGVVAILYCFEFGKPVLQILLGLRGIDQSHLDAGANLLLMLFSLMLFHGLNNFQRKLLLAFNRVRALYLIGCVASAVAAGAAWVAIPALGIPGIGLAMFVEASLMLVAMMLAIRYFFGSIYFYSIESLLRWAIVGVVFILVTYWWLPVSPEMFTDHDRLIAGISLAGHSLIFAAILLLIAWFAGIRELRTAMQQILQIARRIIA